MIAKIKELYFKYREIISYLFWGVMSTVVNYGAYFLCTMVFHLNYLISNGIAWVAAVLFAFVTNKLFVFESKSWEPKLAFKEFWQFVSARIFSGLLETGMLYLFVDVLGFPDAPIKIIASILVVILNYIFSKLIIFKKSKE